MTSFFSRVLIPFVFLLELFYVANVVRLNVNHKNQAEADLAMYLNKTLLPHYEASSEPPSLTGSLLSYSVLHNRRLEGEVVSPERVQKIQAQVQAHLQQDFYNPWLNPLILGQGDSVKWEVQLLRERKLALMRSFEMDLTKWKSDTFEIAHAIQEKRTPANGTDCSLIQHSMMGRVVEQSTLLANCPA
jgi:hypothetical protein